PVPGRLGRTSTSPGWRPSSALARHLLRRLAGLDGGVGPPDGPVPARRPPRPTLVPAGYGLGLVGVAMFVAGGVADGRWHTLFGVEVSVAALLSPSHLLLLGGGLLMVTSPVRSAWSSP